VQQQQQPEQLALQPEWGDSMMAGRDALLATRTTSKQSPDLQTTLQAPFGAGNVSQNGAATPAACRANPSTLRECCYQFFYMLNVPARQQCPCVDVAHEELL
jgi:hypothetical protein